MVNSLRKRFSCAPLALKDDTFVFYDEVESVRYLTLLSPAMQGQVGLGSAQPCEARNPPAIPPCCCWCGLLWLLLLLLSFLSWQSRLFPTPSPPTLLLPSRWHIGSVEDFGWAAGLLGAADQLVSLSACQLVQVEVAVEEQQHNRFLTDDPKS